jgi:hypothetical protein
MVWLVGVGLSTATLAAAPADPFPGLDAKWRVYDSPHFELFSRVSDGESREMLRNLEGMRAFFLQHLELTARPAPRVTIYAFPNLRLFKAYAATEQDGHVGEYRLWPDRDVITLSLMDGHDLAMWIVYSSYTKHLLKLAGADLRKSWAHQGLAMLLGNFELSGNRVQFGASDPLRSRLAQENPRVDVAQLLRAEEGRSFFPAQEQSNIFHAQCWAMLHYWYIGQSTVPVATVNRFLKFALTHPAAEDEAALAQEFQECFGVDYAEMSRRLSTYLRRGSFISQLLPLPAHAAAPIRVRPLDVVELRERLAELRLRNRRDPAGKFVLLEALDGPRAARAAEVLGTDALVDQDDRRAQEYWMRAAAAGSENPTVALAAAQMEFTRWFARRDVYFRLPAEKAAELRRLLLRSIELTPTLPENYEALAWVESAAPEPNPAHLNRVQRKFDELRDRVGTLFALALARARLGDVAGGLALLDSLPTLREGSAEAAFLRQARADLLRRQAAAAP